MDSQNLPLKKKEKKKKAERACNSTAGEAGTDGSLEQKVRQFRSANLSLMKDAPLGGGERL